MIYKPLNNDDHIKFSEKWNLLRDSDSVEETIEWDAADKYFNKYPEKAFEAARFENMGYQIGFVRIDKKKIFALAVKDKSIVIFDDLEKFLKI